jgi:hypothetical protein
MTGVYVPGQTQLDSNGAIFSTDTFINQGSTTVGCRGLGAWQIQSTNYSVTANTSHTVTMTYFSTISNWGALTGAYLTLSITNTSTGITAGSGLFINPSTPNGTTHSYIFTPLPGITYKVFGAINNGTFAPEPVCRPNHANSATIYFDSYSGGEPNNPVGFASSASACTTGTGGIAATVYYDGTFGAGTTLYANSYSNDLWDNNGGYFFKDGYSFDLDGSTINNYTACPTPVTINIGTQTTADGNGDITVYAWTTGNVNVDTNVTVQFLWTGDLFNTINDSVIIYSGTSCSGGITFGGADIGEYTSTFDIASLTPTYSATQNYVQGTATTPVTTCP